MGCLPFKAKRDERHNEKREEENGDKRGVEVPALGHLRELAVMGQSALATARNLTARNNVVEELDIEQELIAEDNAKNAKLPGTVEETARDDPNAPLLGSHPSQSAFNYDATTLASFSHGEEELKEEDLQSAAVLQAVVRAYLARKSKQKEENTPFSDFMASRTGFAPHFSVDWEDNDLLIPQVPNFRQALQQQSSQHFQNPLSSPPPQPPSQGVRFHEPPPQQIQQQTQQQGQQPTPQPSPFPRKPLLAQVLQRQSSKLVGLIEKNEAGGGTGGGGGEAGAGAAPSSSKPPLATTFKQAPPAVQT